MSRAVDAAKPVAEKLVKGVAGRYDEGDIAKLVPWLSITTTMQEFISTPDTIVITPEERSSLKETNLPPSHWTIWIGYYDGVKWNPINHVRYSGKLGHKLVTEDGVQPPVEVQRFQAATFTIRNLLIHAFNATHVDLVAEYRQFVWDVKWNLFQIWPTVHSGMTWPRFPVFDAEMHAIVTRFGGERHGHRDMSFHLGG